MTIWQWALAIYVAGAAMTAVYLWVVELECGAIDAEDRRVFAVWVACWPLGVLVILYLLARVQLHKWRRARS